MALDLPPLWSCSHLEGWFPEFSSCHLKCLLWFWCSPRSLPHSYGNNRLFGFLVLSIMVNVSYDLLSSHKWHGCSAPLWRALSAHAWDQLLQVTPGSKITGVSTEISSAFCLQSLASLSAGRSLPSSCGLSKMSDLHLWVEKALAGWPLMKDSLAF